MFEVMRRELWDRRWSLLAYCLIALVLLWMYIALFPTMQQQAEELAKAFSAYPKELFKAFGIDSLTFDTLEKFLAMEQISFMWPILAIVLALSRSGNALAGEIEKRTMGLYLSLPVSRLNIFLAKYFAALITLTIFTMVSVLGALPIASLYHIGYDAERFVSLAVLSLLFVWALMAFAMALSAVFSERGRVYAIATGAIVLMYAANVVASLRANMSWLHKISVFYYYNSQDILIKHELHTSSFVVLGLAILAFTGFGLWWFNRRDMAV